MKADRVVTDLVRRHESGHCIHGIRSCTKPCTHPKPMLDHRPYRLRHAVDEDAFVSLALSHRVADIQVARDLAVLPLLEVLESAPRVSLFDVESQRQLALALNTAFSLKGRG